MKIKALVFSTLASVALAAPCFAGGIAGFAGATTSLFVDVPEGVVVNSTVKCPVKATKSLAEAFGDEKGWKQNIVGALIGIPTGAVFGVPYGAVMGARHAFSVGWDKPFSAESFVVSNTGE